MTDHLQRAMLLIAHRRHEEALNVLQQAIGDDPTDATPHAYRAIVLCRMERYDEACEAAGQAIHLQPDNGLGHYALGLALHYSNQQKKALQAVEEAIRLDPHDPEQFSLLSAIHLAQSKWKLALEAAQRGLAVDSEHPECTNLRAIALRQLGETDDAADTLQSALADNPENAVTHANIGWNLIHQRKYKDALGSFQEALRLDPMLDMARLGVVEALKARNPLYAGMLRFFLWLGRFPPQVQLALLIGAVVGLNVFGQIASKYPTLEPWVEPLFACYLLFVFATWMADPFFNLVLLLNRYGRYALSKVQKHEAILLVIGLLPGIVFNVLLLLMTEQATSFWVKVLPFLIVFPILTAPKLRRGPVRWLGYSFSVLMVVMFLVGLFGGNTSAIEFYTWGCILSTWAANFLPRERG